MIGKKVHISDIYELYNNLLYDVSDKITATEIYSWKKRYNDVILQEKLQAQEQEKQDKKQEQELLEKIKQEVEKQVNEILKKLRWLV